MQHALEALDSHGLILRPSAGRCTSLHFWLHLFNLTCLPQSQDIYHRIHIQRSAVLRNEACIWLLVDWWLIVAHTLGIGYIYRFTNSLFSVWAAFEPGIHGTNRGSSLSTWPDPRGVQWPSPSERDLHSSEQVLWSNIDLIHFSDLSD